MKSLALSKYFEVVHPEYVFLKLTPVKSIRNYNSDKIARAIGTMYRNLLQHIKHQNKKYFFEVPAKVSYYIYMEKQTIEFYFIVPVTHLTLFRDKVGDTWHGITIKHVDRLPLFSADAVKFKLSYSKEEALSLATDKRTNTLLASLLNVVDVIEDGDRCGVFYNFIPCGQRAWRAQYERTLKRLNDNHPVDFHKVNVGYCIKMALLFICETINIAINSLTALADPQKVAEPLIVLPFQLEKPILDSTRHKKEDRIIQTQILAFSDSADALRRINNAYGLCEAFKSITGDNELQYRRHFGDVNIMQRYLRGVTAIKTSAEECQNFIALPGREIIDACTGIEHIDTYESLVPTDLQTGVICIGTNTYRGQQTSAYLSTDKEYRNLPLVIIGPNRSGKSTLLGNVAKDTINAGECTFFVDYCGSCQLTKEVAAKFPKDKVLVIDCEDSANLQGLGYNELNSYSTDAFKAYRNTKMKTMQLLTMVNSINDDDKNLRPRMDRFLESAANVVFISDGPVRDVFAILQNHRLRQDYIARVPAEQLQNLEEYMMALRELDEVDKKTEEVIGTRTSGITGVIDRVNKLKQNIYTELMLKRDCSNNINLLHEIQKPQLICLRMPEIMFTTEAEKDIYATYWTTKIWLALQIREWELPREQHIKVNLIFDELSQVPHAQDFLRSKLSQIPKFTAKLIISCHYLAQIPIIRAELEGADSSYMLIKGCKSGNYNELKNELMPYTYEDLLCLKEYHSLNLIKSKEGYARFITKLPYNP